MRAPFRFVVGERVLVALPGYASTGTVVRKRRVDAGAYVRVDQDPPDAFLESRNYDDVNRLLVVYPDDCRRQA